MTVLERDAGNVTLLDLDGRLTLDDGAPLLRETVATLLGRGCTRLVFSMQKVRLVDSTGLAEIVRAHTATTSHGGGIRLLEPTERLVALLKTLHLDEVLPPYVTEDSAIQSFS